MELQPGEVFVKLDDSVENLLNEMKAYIEGTDRHEQIMDAFNQQNCENLHFSKPHDPKEFKLDNSN